MSFHDESIYDEPTERRRRRWVKPSAHLYMRPDAWRWAKPGTPDDDRPDWAAGYRPPAWFKAMPDREALAEMRAAQEKAAADERALQRELAAIRYDFELLKSRIAARDAACRSKANFNPDQPRVPAGNPDGGQWTDGGGGGGLGRESDPGRVVLAQYDFGLLIGQSIIRNGRGRMCFYRYSFGIVMVPGLTNLGCLATLPSAGATHGRLIANDN